MLMLNRLPFAFTDGAGHETNRTFHNDDRALGIFHDDVGVSNQPEQSIKYRS